MTLGQSIAETRKRLEPHYSDGEARALVREILFRLKGWTPVDIAVKADEPVSGFIQSKISEAVDRLLRDEPVQYIFRRATFYGLDFTVTPDVLIPRPETAELVDIIVGDHSGQSDLRVADLCTGSGCIACALARNLPFAEVTAIDISEPAIAVARENASQLKVDVDVRRDDVLALTPPEAPLYDIIVSNPPYITQSEKTSVDANVLLYEPHSALFVPDTYPLLFYEAIGLYAVKALAPRHSLYLEINPLHAEALRDMLARQGWHDIDLRRDTSGKLRFAIATRTS